MAIQCASPIPCRTTWSIGCTSCTQKAGSLEELEGLLPKHKAARYRATEYLRPEARERLEYRDLFRARDSIARLLGVLLFKRLE